MSDIPAGWHPDPSAPGQERWWDGAQWSNDVRPVAAPPVSMPPPAAPAPPPPAPTPAPAPEGVGGQTWKISDHGKNGTVTMEPQGLTRLVKKTLGKDDRQFIPFSSISYVQHDRKRVGRDVVLVHVGATQLEWKVQTDAEGFVNAVNMRIA